MVTRCVWLKSGRHGLICTNPTIDMPSSEFCEGGEFSYETVKDYCADYTEE